MNLIVEAWDEDIGSTDDLIGVAEMNVSQLVAGTVADSELLCELWDAKGKEKRGTIVLQVSSSSNTKLYGDSLLQFIMLPAVWCAVVVCSQLCM